MLSCREVVELVTGFLERALGPAEEGAVGRHLASCTGCRTYLDQIMITVALLGRGDPASGESRGTRSSGRA